MAPLSRVAYSYPSVLALFHGRRTDALCPLTPLLSLCYISGRHLDMHNSSIVCSPFLLSPFSLPPPFLPPFPHPPSLPPSPPSFATCSFLLVVCVRVCVRASVRVCMHMYVLFVCGVPTEAHKVLFPLTMCTSIV